MYKYSDPEDSDWIRNEPPTINYLPVKYVSKALESMLEHNTPKIY